MPDKEPATLRPVPEGTLVNLTGRTEWEPHPDGKGYRPIIPAVRGLIEIPCPHCGSPLVRQGTDAVIRRSAFGCGVCHLPSLGNDVTPAVKRKAKDI
jgi:hypothetical protein